MTRDEIITFVTGHAPEAKQGTNKQYPEFVVPASDVRPLAEILKNDPAAGFDYLFCLTASDRKDGLHVIYYVNSTTLGHSMMLRVVVPDKQNPVVPSVSDVWRSAEYHEREVFDLFGIRFEGNPDLRRLFLDDDWTGYPLRKDYKDPHMLQN